MNDLRKAAEMALERLERHEYWMDEEAIQALRQALAQDALRKLAEIDHELGLFVDTPQDALAQPLEDWEGVAADQAMTIAMLKLEKRAWVGLTDEERQEIVKQEVYWDGIVKAIEAKLKEKNA